MEDKEREQRRGEVGKRYKLIKRKSDGKKKERRDKR